MPKKAFWLATASLLSLSLGLLPTKEILAKPQAASFYNAYDLIADVNALRASNGLPAYNVDSILMQIAQAHSEYQASTGIVTHYSANGSRPFQRALAAGYPVDGDLSAGGLFSENILSGAGLTPTQAVSAWMGDSQHQTTMLSAVLQDVGAGVAEAGGLTYYTLDVGVKSGSTVNIPPVSGSTGSTSVPGTPGTIVVVQPVVTSTALENGTVYHVVQSGQALWSIALAYNTTVDKIKLLNKLTSNDIFEGQKLLIRRDKISTSTPEEPTVTVTSGVLLSTATVFVTSTAKPTFTPLPVPPATRQSGGVAVVAIIIIALIGAGVGTWLSTKKPV